jgi:hypothetical protein
VIRHLQHVGFVVTAGRTWTWANETKTETSNPRRRHRTYPRAVKRARHNSYRVKRPGDHGTRHPGPATISLVNNPSGPATINLASNRNLTLAA